jgi:hypothetical protein
VIRYICHSYVKHPWMFIGRYLHPSVERLGELGDLSRSAGAAADAGSEEFSRILQDLRIADVWKWTWRHRLVGMDRLLSEYAVFRGWTRVRMLDLGASDGITSLDTVEYLQAQAGISAQLTMVERDSRVLCFDQGGLTLYFTPSSRRPFLARRGRLALFFQTMEGLEGALFNRLANRVARGYGERLARVDLDRVRTISMVNPAVRRCPSIDVCERDLFVPEPAWHNAFDAVRVSNVLNPSYYSEARIREALGLLHSYLREGGALLASRNVIERHGETEMGGLWRKEGPGFVRQAGLEKLPEIAGLIDELRVESPTARAVSP